jgi:mannosylglycerate hydrolase
MIFKKKTIRHAFFAYFLRGIMAEQLDIIIVPHTHWDREWYQTFQQFRARLVKTIDKLLDILDSDDHFSHFLLDGQTIILDDYLEIEPEQEERLKRYTRAGRILVGPWYVQPDEFLVSGEALIRNLQLGIERASEFGGLMRVGYVPDTFGHIAQLPQILQGFGIDNAVFWRGVGAEAHKSEFEWAAPDGTMVLVVHLADAMGYSNARQLPLNVDEFVTRVELLAANILPKATTNTLLFMNGSDHLQAQRGLPEVIVAANKVLAHIDPERRQLLTRFIRGARHGYGLEAAPPEETLPQYDSIHLQIGTLPQYIERVRQQNTQFETLHGEMRSSQYSHLLPAVLSTRMWIKQQNSATEHLLENWVEPLTAWAALLGAPYPRGLIRTAWKYLLQNHPHDSICGCSIDQVHRENSTRFAQSQQIGECVLAQAMQDIAEEIDTRAPLPHAAYEPVPIVVFNPTSGPRNAQVQAVVQLPGSLHNAVVIDERGASVPYRVINRWRQEIGSMPFAREMLSTAVGLAGVDTPSQLLQMAHGMISSALGQDEDSSVISRIYIENYTESPLHHVHHTPQPGVVYIEVMIAPRGRISPNEQELTAAVEQILGLLKREDIHTLEVTLVDQARETINFIAADLPAYGFKTFWLYPRGVRSEELHHNGYVSQLRSLLTGQNSIENEFYRVEACIQDGTLIVTDKENGVVFRGLNRFIDGGDVGDLYTYCPPDHDALVSEPLESPKIELTAAGPVRATLRVSGRWSLPTGCTANRTERSVRTTICPITSEISLVPGVRRIDIHTSVENRAKDHRLRVIFPVPYAVEHAVAEGTFEVRARPVAPPVPPDVSEWAEEPVSTYPQKRFVDVSDGKTGLGILNRGLPEYEILQDGPGVDEEQAAVAVTLLRCVDWLSRGDLATRHGPAGPMEYTPEAQCQGHYEFDYALVPHSGNWEAEEALVLREAQAFNIAVPARAVVTELHKGQLPSRASLLSVAPAELVVSAIKRSNGEGGVVVRVYNPLAHEVEARIRPGFPFARAYLANLLEERMMDIETTDEQTVRINIRGGGIMTLLFT